MSGSCFGKLTDGTEVQEVVLKKGQLEAWVLTYGAVVRDLKFDGRTVVLGFNNLDDYLNYSPHFGAIPGRFANRIDGGKFELDGIPYQVTCNMEKKHHLHGGLNGFGKSNWTIEKVDSSSVLLKFVSPDGDEGYPGNVEVFCRYTLTGSNSLRVRLTAVTDKPTLVNLTHHSYFNLDGSADICDHVVEIAAEKYLPVNEDFIPSGEIRGVEWTPYDFRSGRKVRRMPGEENIIFDNNFCLSDQVRSEPEFAASVEGNLNDVRMEVWTTEPGIQFYDGYKLNVPVSGLEGRNYGKRAGLCLEPQRWPDSPNHPEFVGAVLRPGEKYNHISEFRFS